MSGPNPPDEEPGGQPTDEYQDDLVTDTGFHRAYSAPEVEQDVLSDVGTYGKQIGQIGDALLVLIERMSPDMKLDSEPAIITLKKMLHDVADIKERHHRKAIRPRPTAHDGAEERSGV